VKACQSLGTKSENVTISVKTNDELGALGNTFNEMVNNIRQYQIDEKKKASFVAIGQTTAQIAHDVRKPLTSMKAILTMLPEIKDNPDLLNKFMADVDRNISQTNAMLSEILEFSSDSLELDKKQCDVQSLILAVLSDVFRGKEAVNISIEYDFEHNKYIHADINRMIRVFTNIVGNAVEAMQGKGRLFFKTYDVGENVEIHIGNSGSPIPEEIIPKLFDPFFTKNKKGGTGLGLSISQKLVELHGGQISVYSFPENDQQDEVTKFILTIPSCGGDIVANPDELIRHSNELKMFKEEKAVRIDYGESKNMSEFMKLLKQRNKESYFLIMDDEPLFRETVRSLIRSIPQIVDHIKVIEASSAEEALMLFKECAFDYVIADIDMGIGKMNGYEFAGTVLEKYPCTHVLIHSNKRKKELDKNIREIKSSRFMGFLPKPMKQSELLQFLALKTFETIQEKTQAAKLELKKRKRNVLIANDDTSLLLAFKILLKSQNVNVFTAASVERALDHINNDKIDIILSDINFGEGQKDGYSLLSKVRNMDPNVPFYLISGYSRSEEEPKAKKMGATGYLQQPVNPDELRKLVSDLN
ncbi:response regulator, partial [bacterium]|nr:response regulator [bacterium]